MINNSFLNKKLYYKHFIKKERLNRIKDFLEIYDILKKHLEPTERARINKNNMKEYINLYKPENRKLIKTILDKVHHVNFEDFKKELFNQTKRFNKYLISNKIEHYVFCIAVGTDGGNSSVDYNIYKSNLWVFMIMYSKLKIKPYDIMLNFGTSLRLHHKKIRDYLIVDDCIYSGSQLIDNVLFIASPDMLFYNKKSYNIKIENETMIEPVHEKICNVHLVIPYCSRNAINKINELEFCTGLNIIKYCSFIVNNYKYLLTNSEINKISNLQIGNIFFSNFVPLFFDHKIADNFSTIEIILIKGQVLDDINKKFVFIDACKYDKEIKKI